MTAIVAGSLAIGSVAALVLVFAPFIPVTESAITGALLCGIAIGWAMLVLLSTRLTDQPQHWAAVPALFFGVSGLLLIMFGSSVDEALGWVWPPLLLALAIWVITRVHRRMPSRSGRALLFVVCGVLIISSIGGGYQRVGAAADANAFPAPGRLIDVGGHRMHLNCTGSGSPTVILEPGGGEMSSNMGWIAPAVAGRTRVCVYDRSGRGWSEPAPTGAPQDGSRIATDLHSLLHRAGVTGPYVLAGHSFGGLYVRVFAAQYPHEVAGLVLIDSTAAKPPARPNMPTPVVRTDGVLARTSTLISVSARLGLARVTGLTDFSSLPPRSRDELRANAARASTIRSTIDEYAGAGAAVQEAAALRDVGARPLIVLTATVGNADDWFEAQDRLARLSTNSAHRVVPGASHEALVGEREYAEITSQAILDVVTAVRDHTQLTR
ncbi:alpha/beta fold hydrolase [Microlunatus sp. Gsoil 973]|uniref:alpha/beta fold hydrolase n=1 Tax=Microlunatus sp. Gsoil 973 TaxID=2672569 RepID=UPI001E479104|nr:alpha/beta hydrolase [Microlunatus sp. Gsoil 973]